jgi:hypothetical protein
LSCSSFSEIFLFACNWLANFSFSFCSCSIFCWTRSSSLSVVSSPSSSFSCMYLLTVDFGTPSYKFTVNICMYLIF